MRTLLIGILLLMAGVVQAFPVAVNSNIDILPNVQLAAFYSATDQTTTSGLLSNMLRYKALDLSLGVLQKSNRGVWTLSLSLALDRANFGNVQYLWQGILYTSIGTYAAYDFETSKWDAGLTASIIKIDF